MARITISYRRDDSGAITGRIFDRLVAHYGRESIFRDIDNIPLGVDFRDQINRVLDQSDIVLAIVGPRWIGPRRGQSRLDNEADPVRLEIEAVLRRNVPLIPVLVLGAPMPQANQLPESLRDFAYRNGIQVDAGQDFDTHIARLTRAMDRLLEIAAAGDSVALMRGGPVSEIEVAQPWAEPAAPVAAPPAPPPTAPAPVAAPPVAAPIAAAPAVASAPRGSRLWLGAALGLAVGAAAAAAVAVVLRPAAPPAPPEVAALAAEKQAAEARLTALQGELAAAKKAADQDRQQLAAARQQAAPARRNPTSPPRKRPPPTSRPAPTGRNPISPRRKRVRPSCRRGPTRRRRISPRRGRAPPNSRRAPTRPKPSSPPRKGPTSRRRPRSTG